MTPEELDLEALFDWLLGDDKPQPKESEEQSFCE